MSLLQEHLEELGSAIIDVCEDKIKLTGFMSPERLLDYYDGGYDCRFSVGVYPKDDFDVAYVKDNSLVLILENGIEMNRYNFIPLINETVKYKLPGEKSKSKVYTIRQCSISDIYNYKDMDKSILFKSDLELWGFFKNEYKVNLTIMSEAF